MFELFIEFFCNKHMNAMAITQSLNRKSSNPKENTACLCESGRTLVGKDLLAGLGGDTVGEREFQALGEELLDVRAADALVVLDLNDAEDLVHVSIFSSIESD